MDVAVPRSLSAIGVADIQRLPQNSYERIAALAKSYCRRLADAGSSTAAEQPLECEECARSVLNEESVQRRSIEDEERDDTHAVVDLWMRRWPVFASELRTIRQAQKKVAELAKERALLERQLYREEFLDFWKKEKQECSTRPVDVTKVLPVVYKYDVLPFAADPVECWERGIIVPPELQVSPALSDLHGRVFFPPFHELSMKLREAYNQYQDQRGSVTPTKEVFMRGE